MDSLILDKEKAAEMIENNEDDRLNEEGACIENQRMIDVGKCNVKLGPHW